GLDPLWSIVRILFPSTGGNLTTTSMAEGNFGTVVGTNVSFLIDLLRFVTRIRVLQSKVSALTLEKRERVTQGTLEKDFIKLNADAIFGIRNSMRVAKGELIETYEGFEEFR